MDLNPINRVLGSIDREVWVITAAGGNGRRGGLTATAVSAASLDPERPRLLVGITPNHYTAELIDGSNAFGAHLLRSDQAAVAWNFADGSGRNRDKLAALATNITASGCPILADCLAWLECRCASRVTAESKFLTPSGTSSGKNAAMASEQEGGTTCCGSGPSRREGTYFAADRIWYWADILGGQQLGPGPPLRENAFIASLTDGQRQQLAEAKAADLALLGRRPEP